MTKLMNFIALILVTSVAADTAKADGECTRLYEAKKYDEALAPCLEQEDAFRLGYIYGRQENCTASHSWYQKDGSATAFQNMGINRLFGTRGCTKNLDEAEAHFETSLKKSKSVGAYFFMGELVDERNNVQRNAPPSKEGFNNYLLALNASTYRDSDWDNEKRDRAKQKVVKYIRDDRQRGLNLLMDKTAEIGFRRIGDSLKGVITDNADWFFKADVKSFNRFKQYTEATFDEDDEFSIYLKARMLELGIGEIENLKEAYRLYLLAAAKGLGKAVDRKEDLRDKLTAEERSEATCLAEKGLDPNWIQRQFC